MNPKTHPINLSIYSFPDKAPKFMAWSLKLTSPNPNSPCWCFKIASIYKMRDFIQFNLHVWAGLHCRNNHGITEFAALIQESLEISRRIAFQHSNAISKQCVDTINVSATVKKFLFSAVKKRS